MFILGWLSKEYVIEEFAFSRIVLRGVRSVRVLWVFQRLDPCVNLFCRVTGCVAVEIPNVAGGDGLEPLFPMFFLCCLDVLRESVAGDVELLVDWVVLSS